MVLIKAWRGNWGPHQNILLQLLFFSSCRRFSSLWIFYWINLNRATPRTHQICFVFEYCLRNEHFSLNWSVCFASIVAIKKKLLLTALVKTLELLTSQTVFVEVGSHFIYSAAWLEHNLHWVFAQVFQFVHISLQHGDTGLQLFYFLNLSVQLSFKFSDFVFVHLATCFVALNQRSFLLLQPNYQLIFARLLSLKSILLRLQTLQVLLGFFLEGFKWGCYLFDLSCVLVFQLIRSLRGHKLALLHFFFKFLGQVSFLTNLTQTVV